MNFKEACELFGGTYEEKSYGEVCRTETRNGFVEITFYNTRRFRIVGDTGIQNISIDFSMLGERVEKIEAKQGQMVIHTTDNNLCSLYKSGKIVHGFCKIDTKTVSFTVDP